MPFLENHLLSDKTQILKQNEKTEIRFDTGLFLEGRAEDYRMKLRLRGDVCLHPAWMYEGGLPFLYRDIDDSLSRETHHSSYSLKIQANGEDWPRRAYYKILCPPKINSQYPVPEGGGEWRFTGLVKAEDFHLEVDMEEAGSPVLGERAQGASAFRGKAEVRFECFQRKEGGDPRDLSGVPDVTVTVDLPRGSYSWREFSCPVPLWEDTAAVLVTISVEHARGTLWLEDFCLQNDKGFNILPPFAPSNRYHEFFNWYGENLSHKEWTDLKISLNGKELPIFSFFQRCYRGSENELELPAGYGKDGENLIEIENVSDYFQPLPFTLQQVELLCERKAPVRIAWCPEIVTAGKEFGILLKTYEPNVQVEISARGLEAPEALDCKEAGLQILRVKPKPGAKEAELSVYVEKGEGYREGARIGQIVEREEDGVLAGSGDAIYIPQEMGEMEDFLIWYLENGLGNMITFRPVYRWSGTRECNEALWQRMRALCKGLNLHYCHIIDGRELPGLNANPTNAMLAGPYFMGHQAHERDGALYCWLQRKHPTNDILFEELSQRIFHHEDYDYREPIEYDGEQVYFCFHPTRPRNMQEAAEQFVCKSRYILRGIERHTGASVLFKYFFQAGLKVGGAELMYGPLEVNLAALRGASFAFDRPQFAAHLAVQWGTTPHDTPERYRRYQLALLVCYLQGVHHINTEEGLYRMEEMFAVLDRFSEPCIRHGEVERNFVRFIKAHSRRGVMHRGIALLHGAYDGWACFCRRNVWSQEGEQWKFDVPEESWDLLNVFYPDSVLDAIYRHPCPNEPQGYYTRTPYGAVDILPVEADIEKMNYYKAMAFLGWNTADTSQIERLTAYVRQGGVLLLGWPHLFTDTDRHDAIYGTPHPLDASGLTGVTLVEFAETDGEGLTLGLIRFAEAEEQGDIEVLKKSNGQPLLIKRRLGKGTVYFINAREYPAAPSVREIYEGVLRGLGEREIVFEKERGILVSEDTVETVIYDREDGFRDIYAINVDWYSAGRKEAKARLFVDGREYEKTIRRGAVSIFTISPKGEVCAEEVSV